MAEKKERISYDLENMTFERKGNIFEVTFMKDFLDECQIADIVEPEILRQCVLYAVQKKAVDAIASMGGKEYTDNERRDAMSNVVAAINRNEWRVKSAAKDTISKATFAKVYNVAELRMLFKIAPQVLTAEQKQILEWADSNEKDLFLEAHPNLKEIVESIEL